MQYTKNFCKFKNKSKEQLLTYQRRQPKRSDLLLISWSLTSEFMAIDSENDQFRKLPKSILTKIERSVYNRKRGKLVNSLNSLRLKLASAFKEFENYFIVDSISIPLEICKLSRSSRSKICKEVVYAFLDKYYFAVQSFNYYGV